MLLKKGRVNLLESRRVIWVCKWQTMERRRYVFILYNWWWRSSKYTLVKSKNVSTITWAQILLHRNWAKQKLVSDLVLWISNQSQIVELGVLISPRRILWSVYIKWTMVKLVDIHGGYRLTVSQSTLKFFVGDENIAMNTKKKYNIHAI